MEIEFRGSPGRTLGIEVETVLVDRSTRALASHATDVLAELGAGHPDGEHPRAKHELFDCTVEVITGVCDTVAEARADLAATLVEVRAAATRRGSAVMCAGTHPAADWRRLHVSPKERYAQLVDSLGWPARRLSIYGIHYHVGVPSGAAAVAVVGSLAYHLPIFLALSASSPYWHGDDTGLASARTKIFEGLPTAGLPPRLGGWDDFEHYMAALVRAGAIESIREVWWDVRPHPDFGTVELRMCDGMTNLDEIAAVAALAQALVADLVERFEAGEALPGARDWVLRENKWLAARHGLDAELLVDEAGTRASVRDLVDRLVDRLGPTAQRLGCATELAAVREIVAHGSSADRQRRWVAEGAELADVVDRMVAELDASLDRGAGSAPDTTEADRG